MTNPISDELLDCGNTIGLTFAPTNADGLFLASNGEAIIVQNGRLIGHLSRYVSMSDSDDGCWARGCVLFVAWLATRQGN